jgi:hypothetical protein
VSPGRTLPLVEKSILKSAEKKIGSGHAWTLNNFGQRATGSGQRAAGSGQRAAGNGQREASSRDLELRSGDPRDSIPASGAGRDSDSR